MDLYIAPAFIIFFLHQETDLTFSDFFKKIKSFHCSFIQSLPAQNVYRVGQIKRGHFTFLLVTN